MGEAQYEFDNDLVSPNGFGDRRHLHIFGDLVDEVLAVKTADSPATNATSHDRNAEHIGLWNHGFHGGVYLLISELSRHVPVEERTKIGRLPGFGGRHWQFCFCKFLDLHDTVLPGRCASSRN